MLANVLSNKTAIQTSIQVVRAFIKLREFAMTNRELAYKLEEIERKTDRHDDQIKAIFTAIKQLMIPSEKPKNPIGF